MRAFIAYSRADRELAVCVEKALCDRGYEIFDFDCVSNVPFAQKIAEEITRCELFVAVLNPNRPNYISSETRREIEFALRLKKKIVAVVDAASPTRIDRSQLPVELRNIQIALFDATDPKEFIELADEAECYFRTPASRPELPHFFPAPPPPTCGCDDDDNVDDSVCDEAAMACASVNVGSLIRRLGRWLGRKSQKEVVIRLVANADCDVYVDNKPFAELQADTVTTARIATGRYFFLIKPADSTRFEKHSATITVSERNQLIDFTLPSKQKAAPAEKHTIKCFIAGSTSLDNERNTLRAAIAQTHNTWNARNTEILSFTFEDFARHVVDGGQQNHYDKFLREEADLAVFLISGHVGDITLREFNYALESYQNKKRPQILILNNAEATSNASIDAMKQTALDHNQYWVNYDSLRTLKLEFMTALDWLLINRIFR